VLLLSVDIQARQFLSNTCSLNGIDSEDSDKCEKDCRDNSVDDSKVISDVEV